MLATVGGRARFSGWDSAVSFSMTPLVQWSFRDYGDEVKLELE